MNHLIDAHCHVVTDLRYSGSLSTVSYEIERCVMSNSSYDWKKVKALNHKTIHKGFGIHPWYSHLFSFDVNMTKIEHYRNVLRCKNEEELDEMISLLPDPIHIDSYLHDEFDADVECIGEIGLDKLFKLPKSGFFQEPRERLSSVRVDMDHQIKVFEKLLAIAAKEKLPISVHAVKCHGILLKVCQKLLSDSSVKICLHSFSGSTEMIDLWFKVFKADRIYFSISSCINLKNQQEGEKLLKKIPISNLLIETDCPIDKNSMDDQCTHLEKVVHAISSAHDATNETIMEKINSNFKEFLT